MNPAMQPRHDSHDRQDSNPVNLVNPINGDTWCCSDYDNVKLIDGVDYITVYKIENDNIDKKYEKNARKIIKRQLAYAALRLAAAIEQAIG
jgi:hypothetical protein